jgi:hypothetical protein
MNEFRARNIRGFPQTGDNAPGARNSTPRTWDNAPGTRNSRPRAWDDTPGARNSRPRTRDARPGMVDNQPGSPATWDTMDTWEIPQMRNVQRKPQSSNQFTPFWQRGGWYGTLALGLVIGIICTLAIQIFGVTHPLSATPPLANNDTVKTFVVDGSTVTPYIYNGFQQNKNNFPVQLNNMKVALLDGNILDIAADVPMILGLTASILIQLSPRVENGNIQFHVVTLELGGLSIPGFSKNIEDSVNSQINGYAQGQILASTSSGKTLATIHYQVIDFQIVKNAIKVTVKIDQK